MADTCMVLPQDCWELIFNRVDNLEAISLVCKEFFSISNSLRHSLEVYNPTIGVLCRLLKRFRCLKMIDLSRFDGDIDLAVLKIARSGLNLEALDVSYQKILPVESLRVLGSYMKNLKTLECRYVCFLRDSDLAAIASSLPWLEELDISNPGYNYSKDDLDFSTSNSYFRERLTTDAGIEVLASKVRDLRKINISGNYLSDRSLLALSSNCVFLREIKALNCDCITENCIGFLFRHSPNLVSLSVRKIEMDSSLLFTIENSIAYAKALCDLEIFSTVISDSLLSSIAKVHLPLKKLSLSYCKKFTISGLSLLLQACQSSLEDLDLEGVHFLTDEYMSDLSQYLHNITYINLNECRMLTNSTFFILTRNCPLLVEIEMESTRLGVEEDFGMDLGKNYRILFLRLASNRCLNDESLEKIGFSCPNLQLLDVNFCFQIGSEGIGEIFKSCNKIRHLEMKQYNDTKIFGTDSELSELNLEVLHAPTSKIDDEGMEMIAKRCRRLLYLNLKYCSEVTAKGMKEVVENCRKLREIKFRECCNVSADFVAWMFSSRPSLMTYYPFVPNEDQILHHAYLDW